MEQLNLPMLTVYNGPRLVEREIVEACRTYRDAVIACWEMRTRTNLKKNKLAEDAGLYASHVTDYTRLVPRGKVRNLPPDRINDFEVACGNRMISQWLARQAGLPVLDAAFVQHLAQMQKRAA